LQYDPIENDYSQYIECRNALLKGLRKDCVKSFRSGKRWRNLVQRGFSTLAQRFLANAIKRSTSAGGGAAWDF
jgi:hypothetical protein